MTRLIVDQGIWDRFPRLRVILVWADGIDNRTERPELIEELERRMSALGASWRHPSPQAHPHIAAWRDAIKGTGFSGKKFPSSIEALARRVLTGKGVGPINPLVDFYNRVSLTHLVPAGGWDLEALDGGDLHLALTRGNERFRALGSEESVGVEAGEAAYLVGDQVVTRHFVWRQSDLGKLTRATRRALLISECLDAVGDDVARAVREDLEGGLARHFGVAPKSTVLTAGAEPPSFDFGSDS